MMLMVTLIGVEEIDHQTPAKISFHALVATNGTVGGVHGHHHDVQMVMFGSLGTACTM